MALHLIPLARQRKQFGLLHGKEALHTGVVATLHTPAVVLFQKARYGIIQLLHGMEYPVTQGCVYAHIAFVYGIFYKSLVLRLADPGG